MNDSNQDQEVKVRTGSIPPQKKGIFIAGALILVAVCGVFGCLIGGYQIISRRDVSKLIASILPTPTPLPNPQLHPGILLYSSNFDYRGIWEVGRIDNEWMTLDKSVINSKYLWNTVAKAPITDYSIPTEPIDVPFQKYQASVDVHQLNGPTDGLYGIIFDYVDGNNYWEWSIREGGGCSYLVERAQGIWKDPVARMAVQIKKGEMNTLTVKISKDLLFFYVNGALAGSYKNPSLGESSFIDSKTNGLVVDLFHAGDRSTIEFDNYVISVPPNFDD